MEPLAVMLLVWAIYMLVWGSYDLIKTRKRNKLYAKEREDIFEKNQKEMDAKKVRELEKELGITTLDDIVVEPEVKSTRVLYGYDEASDQLYLDKVTSFGDGRVTTERRYQEPTTGPLEETVPLPQGYVWLVGLAEKWSKTQQYFIAISKEDSYRKYKIGHPVKNVYHPNLQSFANSKIGYVKYVDSTGDPNQDRDRIRLVAVELRKKAVAVIDAENEAERQAEIAQAVVDELAGKQDEPKLSSTRLFDREEFIEAAEKAKLALSINADDYYLPRPPALAKPIKREPRKPKPIEPKPGA